MATFPSKPLLLFITLLLPAWAQERHTVDWAKVTKEASDHLSALLRIDTRNPPGHETRAAKYVRSVLEREGIPVRLFALDPLRANLVARLKGNGSKRPILVMGHTDVVGVQRQRWTVDPFGAIRKGGSIYGRGAQDDKDHVVAGMMLLLLLKRTNVKLDRDVIFLAEAGEEGTTSVGIDYMTKRHWSEIAAEYALAEGGYAEARNGKVRFVEIATTEKVPRGVHLIAHGRAGHGSRPIPDNAVVHLAAAIAKFGTWQPPIRLNETTRMYFERLAGISSPDVAWRYRHVDDPGEQQQIDQYFARYEPGHYSIIRSSVVPTEIQAGFRSNVIPSEAKAYLDVRALPDENMPELYAELRRVIDDPTVDVVPARDSRPAGPPSSTHSEMFQALENTQQRMFPGAVTLPGMLTGATDMAQLRARGVQAYGYGPIVDLAHGVAGGAHGDDERISEESLGKLVEFLWYTVLQVAASK